MADTPRPRRLVVDTDTGIDDAVTDVARVIAAGGQDDA